MQEIDIVPFKARLGVCVMTATVRKNVFVMAVASCRPSLSVYKSSHTHERDAAGVSDFLTLKKNSPRRVFANCRSFKRIFLSHSYF